MKFTRISVASLALIFVTGNAQAVLSAANTLSIESDAVIMHMMDTHTFEVTSDGPLIDSFFVFGDASMEKTFPGTQFSYVNGSALTLDGSLQSNAADFNLFEYPGNFETLGIGIAVLSASGDSATVDMRGWTMNWIGNQASLGGLAWAPGYADGIGYINCAVGSGCAVGSAYTLTYSAAVPDGHPALGYVPVYLELHGTVGLVPEASTYGMMLAGLGLIGFATRRRRL